MNRRRERKPGFGVRIASIAERAIYAAAFALGAVFLLALPDIHENLVKHRQRLAKGILEESRDFCEARGFAANSPEHTRCMLDLDGIRRKREERMAGARGLL